MKVLIENIKPNPNNPRTISDTKLKQLMNSMITFPQMLEKRPLICFTDADGKYVVLGGNKRLQAAQEIGMKELHIELADDWTPEQRDEFLIKDNVSFGEWDLDQLTENFEMDLLAEWGFELPDMAAPEFPEDKDYFDDPGLLSKQQYGVIVICESEESQAKTFDELTQAGHTCKIVVT